MVSSFDEDFKTIMALIRDIKEDVTRLQIRMDKIEKLKKLEK